MAYLRMDATLGDPGYGQRSPMESRLPHKLNPYDAPTAIQPHTNVGSTANRDLGTLAIAAVLILAVVVAAMSLLVPAIRHVTMPRFGWIELWLCLNPLIFLAFWLKTPVRRNLLAASFMTGAIGILNAVTLLISGTVSSVQNEFTDRLHSSWLWAVVPFCVAAGYLCWRAVNSETASPDPEPGQQIR